MFPIAVITLNSQALLTIDLYPIAAMSYVTLNTYMSKTCFLYLN